MPTTNTSAPARNTLSVRPATSRKLLARKAAEQAPAAAMPEGEALEDSFPDPAAAPADALHEVSCADVAPADPALPTTTTEANGGDAAADANAAASPAANAPAATAGPSPAAAPEPEGAPPSPPTAAPAPQPAPAPAWSREDEAAFQAMLARRTAAGPRRGKDVGGMLLRAGDIAPNPDTVVATIVALVANAGGAVHRADLLELMAGATFSNPKAKPGDKAWCTGWIAGAIRAGAIAVAVPADGSNDAAQAVAA